MTGESLTNCLNLVRTQIGPYLKYKLTSKSKKGHGIHSPFVYDLVTNVINPGKPEPAILEFEQQRKILKASRQTIMVQDLGTGSSGKKDLSRIASFSLTSSKECNLLHRIIRRFQPACCLELGTSLGITTAYIAHAMEDKPVYTMEGDSHIAMLAKNFFDKTKLNNISLIQGDIKDSLPELLKICSHPFLAFIDANHSYGATIKYFELLSKHADNDRIIIIHDIHMSKEMEKAWKEIYQCPSATFTIDLFRMGIVFFNKKSPKQHFIIGF